MTSKCICLTSTLHPGQLPWTHPLQTQNNPVPYCGKWHFCLTSHPSQNPRNLPWLLLLSLCLFLGAAPCMYLKDLDSSNKDQTCVPCNKSKEFSHCTARKSLSFKSPQVFRSNSYQQFHLPGSLSYLSPFSLCPLLLPAWLVLNHLSCLDSFTL